MQRDIRHKWFFPYSPETVWEFLTKKELLAQWLMENDFQPIVGHKFRFDTKPKFKFGFDGIVHCEVLEVAPFHRLSYSWRGGPGNGKITLDSLVTWTLTPVDQGTELQMDHTGFKGLKNYMAWFFMNEGWRTKIRNRIMKLIDQKAGAASLKKETA
jgi:uncharacterized protein YndB with AHSA1/START domain